MPDLAAIADDDFCYLTTTGRVSGRPHEIEIWFAVSDSTLYLLSGAAAASDWVRNLVATPAVTVRLREVTYAATARVLEAETDEDARARQLVFEKYQPRDRDDLTSWRQRSLPIALDLA